MGQCASQRLNPQFNPPIPNSVTPVSFVAVDVLYVDSNIPRCRQFVKGLDQHTIRCASCSTAHDTLIWLNSGNTHSAQIIVIHEAIQDMDLPTLTTQIRELHPERILIGVLNNHDEQLVSKCIKAQMSELFVYSRVPTTLFTYIVERIGCIRDSSIVSSVQQLTFHPNHIWT